jgi:hypothetical protein
MDIQEKAREKMNWLEIILHKIPGFKGYYEKEFRRDADHVQRDFIVTQLRKVKTGMNGVIQAASRRKDFELLREYDLFAKTLDKSIGAIRYADQGYSGFFDLVKIQGTELDKVYQQDTLIVEAADAFSEEFKKLAAAPMEPSGLTPLREKLERINGLFEQRIALLKSYEKGESK